jgi:intracellular multiplication protein IcmF
MSLSGIYFTSSIQDGASIDVIKNSWLHLFDLKEKQVYRLEASNNYRYFIEDIFKKVIVAAKQQKQSYRVRLKLQFNYCYALLVAALIVGAISITGYQSYHKNIATINNVEYFLQQQQSAGIGIDSLYTIINKLDQDSKSWWLRLGVNEVKPLQRALYRKYQILFFHKLVLKLENNINERLDSFGSDVEPKKLYDALQTYLMLGNPKKLDKDYVEAWFDNCWSRDSDSEQVKLRQQLTLALQRPFAIELNQQIIDAARDSLSGVPVAPLAYLLLESSYRDQSLKFDSISPISKIYTRKCFNKVYSKQIPKIANNLPQQNWVLGKHLRLKEASVDDVIESVREIYLKEYVAAWETVINYKPKLNFKNLSEAAKDLKELASDDSSLIALLQQIKININIDSAPPSFNEMIDAKLRDLSVINVGDLQKNLVDLARHVDVIAQNRVYNKAAFGAAIDYLQNERASFLGVFEKFSSSQPPVLQVWLQSIVKSTWFVLLDSASVYVNEMWSATIVPEYKKTLANKYPLFENSKNDISFSDFNKFFGPHGVIDRFFNKYIKPFVAVDKTNWAWKNINGQKINFSQGSLEVFLRAALIQKMFYSYKTLMPKVKYTLVPLEMTPNARSFTLHLEGRKIVFNDKEKKKHHLVWPGPNSGSVTMGFVDQQGKYFSDSQLGPWAWFRMIESSNLMSGNNNTRYFELTFDLNGSAAKYELFAADPINPFIPGIINNFRCPDKLS